LCGSGCIPSGACCTDGDCAGGQQCTAGNCGCPAGKHLCGSACIADGSCCTDSECSGLKVCATPGQGCACRTSPARVPIYRSTNQAGDNLMSTDENEGTSSGYISDGALFYLYGYGAGCQWGLLPFYRLYHGTTGEHFYTASQAEYDHLQTVGWTAEWPIGCLAQQPECGAVTLYRLASKFHKFTTQEWERDALIAQGWVLEGPAGFVWTAP
jgi:hypothetical protein